MPYYLAVILYIVFLLAPGTSGLYDGVPLSRLHELITIAILPLFFLLLPVRRNYYRTVKKSEDMPPIAYGLMVMGMKYNFLHGSSRGLYNRFRP